MEKLNMQTADDTLRHAIDFDKLRINELLQ